MFHFFVLTLKLRIDCRTSSMNLVSQCSFQYCLREVQNIANLHFNEQQDSRMKPLQSLAQTIASAMLRIRFEFESEAVRLMVGIGESARR